MPGDLTILMQAANSGDQAALNRLVAMLYVDLRRLAHRCRSGGADVSLNTTGLVHECYLRFLESKQLNINDRAHFFNTAARVMRHLICDYARDKLAQKRGGGMQRIELREEVAVEQAEAEQCLAIDQALEKLAEHHPHQARVVECRYFGGLTEAETAEALDRSLRSVQRDWAAAREWLSNRLEPS